MPFSPYHQCHAPSFQLYKHLYQCVNVCVLFLLFLVWNSTNEDLSRKLTLKTENIGNLKNVFIKSSQLICWLNHILLHCTMYLIFSVKEIEDFNQ